MTQNTAVWACHKVTMTRQEVLSNAYRGTNTGQHFELPGLQCYSGSKGPWSAKSNTSVCYRGFGRGRHQNDTWRLTAALNCLLAWDNLQSTRVHLGLSQRIRHAAPAALLMSPAMCENHFWTAHSGECKQHWPLSFLCPSVRVCCRALLQLKCCVVVFLLKKEKE